MHSSIPGVRRRIRGVALLWAALCCGQTALLDASEPGPVVLATPTLTLEAHHRPVCSAVFSPDGREILSGSMDGTAIVWATDTGKSLATFGGLDTAVESVAFSPDTSKILTGTGRGIRGAAILWDRETHRRLNTFDLRGGYVGDVAFAPDGKSVLVVTNVVDVWDLRTGRYVRTFSGNWNLSCAVFSPDGESVFAGSTAGEAFLWDVSTGKELMTYRTAERHKPSVAEYIFSVAFSPDGKNVLAGTGDGTATLWEAATGKRMVTFRKHEDFVWSVAFSPDGRELVTGSEDGTAAVWDATSGKRQMTLKVGGPVASVAYSPDGKRILTAAGEKLMVWDRHPRRTSARRKRTEKRKRCRDPASFE